MMTPLANQMSTVLTLVTMATASVAVWVWIQRRPRKDFPPGPRGWPLIGNLLEFTGDKTVTELFRDYAEEYGNIFSIRLGQRWAVVLNGSAVIREALVKKGDDFANRPSTFTLDVMTDGGKDVSFGQSTEPSWKLNRKMMHSAFKKLTTDHNDRFEELVYSVTPSLQKHLDSKGAEPFDPTPTMASVVHHIITTMCFGKSYEFDSPSMVTWTATSNAALDATRDGVLADFLPVFRYIPTPAQRKLKDVFASFHQMIDQRINEQQETYDSEAEPTDLMDMVLHARQELIDEGRADKSLIERIPLKMVVVDVFGAGSDSALLTLTWSVALMVQYSEVQTKVAAEVDEIVGRGRLPSLSDRHRMPYTFAVLHEVWRYSTFLPMTLPHATTRDTSLGGFTIPEGTWVLCNAHSIHYDEAIWDEPSEFKPERFLDDSGEFRNNPEGFFSFSFGQRACPGEGLAKGEMFLLISWLFQRYEFQKAPGTEEQDYSKGKEMSIGKTIGDIRVVATRRF